METNKDDHWYIRGRKGCAELIKQELLKRGANDPFFEKTNYDIEGVVYYLMCGIVRVAVDHSLIGKAIIANWEEVKVIEPKPVLTFKPFDKVMVCDGELCRWTIELYAYYDKNKEIYHHVCMGSNYKYCLPYEGNEHLIGVQFKPEHVKGVLYQN